MDVKMALQIFFFFSFPANTMMDFVSRGHWKDLRVRDFAPWFECAYLPDSCNEWFALCLPPAEHASQENLEDSARMNVLR